MGDAFKTSNVVLLGYLDVNLDLAQLYELLPIIPFDFTVGDKTGIIGRETVPYFGIENIIVGIRFKDRLRGIKRGSGHLNSVIGVDLQCCGKNINLKISSDKIQLTGAKSEDMGMTAAHLLLAHIKMCAGHLEHILSLPQETVALTRQWLIDLVRVERITESMELFNGINTTPITRLVETVPSNVDRRMALYLGMFACEYGLLTDYVQKIDTILGYQSLPFEREPQLTSYRVCNGVYNYSLGERISLIQVSTKLHELGYAVAYHNWSSGKKMYVAIPINEASSESVPITPNGDISSDSPSDSPSEIDDHKASHRFVINQSGSIRQTSPTSYAEAHKQYTRLVSDIAKHILKRPMTPVITV